MIVSWQLVDSPLGPVFIAASDNGFILVRVDAPADGAIEELTSLVARRIGLGDTVHLEEGGELTDVGATRLEEYFDRRRLDLELPIDHGDATAFQLHVRKAVCAIPAGETRTYAEVAEAAGYPGAARAVGNVMSDNPVQLAVPCHRVVASEGLGGYGGRPDLKRWLLEHEGATVPPE